MYIVCASIHADPAGRSDTQSRAQCSIEMCRFVGFGVYAARVSELTGFIFP